MTERVTEAELRELAGRSLGPLVVDLLIAELRRLRGLIVSYFRTTGSDVDWFRAVHELEEEARAIREEHHA